MKYQMILALVCALCAVAQTNVVDQPACSWYFELATSGARPVTGGWDNRDLGCNVWVVYAENSPGTGSPSLTFQAAPTNGTGPGTWATFPTAPSVGSNPSTSQVTYMVTTGYQSWLRVLGSGLTTTKGRVLGWKRPGGGSASSGTVTVDNFPAVQDVLNTPVCTLSTNTNVTGSGNTLIAAVSGSLQIQICQITVLTDGTAVDWKLTQGTGASCGTGTGDITPLFRNSPGGSFDLALNPWFNTAGNAVCFNQSAAVNTAVKLMYRYR